MKEGKDYIVFPLDVPSKNEALQFIRHLSGSIGMFKVGLELFIETGPDILREIKSSGPAGIFLDLKLHDIPETVFRAMRRIAELDVSLATVHCGESAAMLKKAVEGSCGKLGVLGVTLLTSVSQMDVQSAGFKKELHSDLRRLVMQRAAMAKSAGCAGIVCSGHEVQTVKAQFGADFLAVTPGIRLGHQTPGKDDQQRVMTPGQAVQNGADLLVIGRPIRDAADPVETARLIAGEIEAAYSLSKPNAL